MGYLLVPKAVALNDLEQRSKLMSSGTVYVRRCAICHEIVRGQDDARYLER